MKKISKFIIAFSLAFLLCLNAHAEKKERLPVKGPKIGLVLAGGGALGFAHVGVLKVLEENRIPIHLVTGTSMGAIVGAAYAAGVPVEEMEEVLTTTDWDELFNEASPRQEVPYSYKSGIEDTILGDGKLGFSEGEIAFPSGAVQGQKVLPLLQRLYGDVPNPVNFDELKLPFRAAVADIETGKAVIPDSGSLPIIVRASMSVPGAFAPVELGEQLVVDGGIANNLPVDKALEMGADILIVVELNADLAKRKDLESPFAVSGQIISLLLAQNATIQKGLMRSKDILIEPELNGMSAAGFADGAEILKRGVTKAREMVDQLKHLAISEKDYTEYRRYREREKEDLGTLAFVEIDTDARFTDKQFRNVLKLETGKAIDRDAIEKGVQRIYDAGQFENVRYEIVERNGNDGVVIHAQKKKWYDEYFRIGAAIEDDFDGQDNYRLAIAYRKNDISTSGSYLDLYGEIGRMPGIDVEFNQPFAGDSPFFIAPSIAIQRSDLLPRVGDDIIAEYHRTFGFGSVELGSMIGRSGQIKIGARRGAGELKRDIGDPTLQEFSYDIADLTSEFVYDYLNQADFPTEGILVRLSHSTATEDLGASDDFTDLTGEVKIPFTFYGRNTLMFHGNFAETFEERPVERSFTAGGFLNTSGFVQDSLLASDYAIGRFLYYRRISEIGGKLLGLGVYGGGSLEFTTYDLDIPGVEDDSLIVGGSLFVGADTPLLPIALAIGMNDNDDVAFYFTLGRIGGRPQVQ